MLQHYFLLGPISCNLVKLNVYRGSRHDDGSDSGYGDGNEGER